MIVLATLLAFAFPEFECSDRAIETTYRFRAETFLKHVKSTENSR